MSVRSRFEPFDDSAFTSNLMKALDLLDQAAPHFTDRQREILSGLRKLRIVEDQTYQAQSQGCGIVNMSDWAILKNRPGGLMWLLAHEAYHTWDRQPDHKEGNANLFANRIKAAVEESGVYRWGT